MKFPHIKDVTPMSLKKYEAFVKSASSFYHEFYDDSIDDISEDIYVIEVKFIINGEKYTELYIDDNGFDGGFDYNDFLIFSNSLFYQ